MWEHGRRSPLKITPQAHWGFWQWFWRFHQNCTLSKMTEVAKARSTLLVRSHAIYAELAKQSQGGFVLQDRGNLYAFRQKKAMQQFAQGEITYLQQHGFSPKYISGSDLQSLEPSLTHELAGGWLETTDGWIQPDTFFTYMQQYLVNVRVKIQTHVTVQGLVKNDPLFRTC